MSIETQLRLAGSRRGRVVLHVVGYAKDRKFAWHWAGIWREVKGV